MFSVHHSIGIQTLYRGIEAYSSQHVSEECSRYLASSIKGMCSQTSVQESWTPYKACYIFSKVSKNQGATCLLRSEGKERCLFDISKNNFVFFLQVKITYRFFTMELMVNFIYILRIDKKSMCSESKQLLRYRQRKIVTFFLSHPILVFCFFDVENTMGPDTRNIPMCY